MDFPPLWSSMAAVETTCMCRGILASDSKHRNHEYFQLFNFSTVLWILRLIYTLFLMAEELLVSVWDRFWQHVAQTEYRWLIAIFPPRILIIIANSRREWIHEMHCLKCFPIPTWLFFVLVEREKKFWTLLLTVAQYRAFHPAWVHLRHRPEIGSLVLYLQLLRWAKSYQWMSPLWLITNNQIQTRLYEWGKWSLKKL